MSSRCAVVIGGGTMGAGIAQCLLESRTSVTLVEGDEIRVHAAQRRLEEGLRQRYKRELDPESRVAEAMQRLTMRVGVPRRRQAPGPELVVEAVYEDAGLKREVLVACEKAYPGALLASNTSALSIGGLAAALVDPTRLLGMHFFNPVPRSELVEIVAGPVTAPASIEAGRCWVDRLGKTAIVVKDSPGFATSRLGVAIGLEAIRMVEEGVASVEDIDTGMVLGYRYPIGPLELSDLIGLDVRLAIAEHLLLEFGDRFAPPALLRAMVARSELGRKTGLGFYRWSSGAAEAR